jgi:hypothetical protein
MLGNRISRVSTGKAAYSFPAYSVGLHGFAMEVSPLLPAVHVVLGRGAMSPAVGRCAGGADVEAPSCQGRFEAVSACAHWWLATR